MKNFFVYLILALLFLILETTLLRSLIPSLLIPDVILIMVFYLAFSRPSVDGALTAFALGYIADVFYAGIIGMSSFTLVFVFAATFYLSKIVVLNSLMIKVGGAMVMSLLKGFLTYLVLRFLNQDIPFFIIFPIAVSTGVVSPFVLSLLQKIEIRFILTRGEHSISP